MNKIVITRKDNIIYYGYFSDGKAVELYCEKNDNPGILGNIYVARVDKVAEGIQGAFLDLTKEQKAYYNLTSGKPVKFTPGHEDKLYGGDLILVQVTKDAVKSKLPVVDSNVCVRGKYFILSFEKKSVNVSRKIRGQERREHLLKLVKDYISGRFHAGCGIVIRTDAAGISDKILLEELESLLTRAESILQKASIAPGRSFIAGEEAYYIRLAEDLPHSQLDEILTDQEDIFQRLKHYYTNAKADITNKIAFYHDDYSLYQLYRFEHYYEESLKKMVPLKSGGSIVIEQTEAMVVIDVNSGAVTKNKKQAENVFEMMNKEAASEIARQLRLRNLSGIILIDFINMKNEDSRNKIFDYLKKECEQDRIPIRVIDFTALHLVEMTRNKVRRSLKEMWTQCHQLP